MTQSQSQTESKVEIMRVRSPDVIKHIKAHLTFYDEEVQPIFLSGLVEAMTNAPESVMVLGAINSQQNSLVGFVVAQNPGPSYPYIYLSQVWSHPDNAWAVVEEFLVRLSIWGMSLGKTNIKAESSRNTEALLRRFNFEPVASVLRFDLNQNGMELQTALINHFMETLQNGRNR